jgi:ABC-type molybdate transport system substrate-binding protein
MLNTKKTKPSSKAKKKKKGYAKKFATQQMVIVFTLQKGICIFEPLNETHQPFPKRMCHSL